MFPAYRMAAGANPADVSMWQDNDDELGCVQNAAVSSQFAQQWKLRVMAHEAALEELAASKLRRPLGRNRAFQRAEIEAGNSVYYVKEIGRKSNPKWRGPAAIPDIGETGVKHLRLLDTVYGNGGNRREWETCAARIMVIPRVLFWRGQQRIRQPANRAIG